MEPIRARVKVTVGSRTEYVQDERGVLHVGVSAKPKGGEANDRVCELIAEHYSVPLKNVHIISGAQSRGKIVLIYANNS